MDSLGAQSATRATRKSAHIVDSCQERTLKVLTEEAAQAVLGLRPRSRTSIGATTLRFVTLPRARPEQDDRVAQVVEVLKDGFNPECHGQILPGATGGLENPMGLDAKYHHTCRSVALMIGDHVVSCAVLGQSVTGSSYHTTGSFLQILFFATHSKLYRRGLGALLVACIKRFLSQHNQHRLLSLSVSSSQRAQSFWRACGFRPPSNDKDARDAALRFLDQHSHPVKGASIWGAEIGDKDLQRDVDRLVAMVVAKLSGACVQAQVAAAAGAEAGGFLPPFDGSAAPALRRLQLRSCVLEGQRPPLLALPPPSAVEEEGSDDIAMDDVGPPPADTLVHGLAPAHASGSEPSTPVCGGGAESFGLPQPFGAC